MARKPESDFFIEFDNHEQWRSFYGMEYIFRFPKEVPRLNVVIAHAMRNTLISFLNYITCMGTIREHHDKWTDVIVLLEMAAKMLRSRFAGPLTSELPAKLVNDEDSDDSELGDMLDGVEGL